MSDTINLQFLWDSFHGIVVDVSVQDQADPELIARMAFVAGAQSVLTCLTMDRSVERFNRLSWEVDALRLAVAQELEVHGVDLTKGDKGKGGEGNG